MTNSSRRARNFLLGFIIGALTVIVPYKATYYFLQYKVYEKLYGSETFLTIVSGVTVFVLGQVFKDFVLQPIQNFKLVLGDIDSKLIYHREVFYELMTVKKPKERTAASESLLHNAQDSIKDLGSRLISIYNTIPAKTLFAFLGVLKSRQSIYQGVSDLVSLADLDYFSSKAELSNTGLSDSEIEDWDKKTYERNIKLINSIRGSLGIPRVQHVLPGGKIEYPLDDNRIIAITKR